MRGGGLASVVQQVGWCLGLGDGVWRALGLVALRVVGVLARYRAV
ncbi:MAG: hypothetical protein ABDI19_01030 [Armatimonadota bacterium]